MGTKANIGVLGDNNVVRVIVASFDGNPEHTGRMLLEHYATEERARELVCIGDCRSVQPTLDACQPYAKREGEDPEDSAPEDMDIGVYESGFFAEFAYLFRQGRWQWRQSHGGRWFDLTPKRCGMKQTAPAAKPESAIITALEMARADADVSPPNTDAKFWSGYQAGLRDALTLARIAKGGGQ